MIRTTPDSGCGSLAVTGSKGGVGKSNLVANVAVALARWGRRVLLVDGDLGLANLDVLFGLLPERNIEHLVRGEATLDEVLLRGPEGVSILPAASGIPELARLDDETRARLMDVLTESGERVDQVLVDTGAGLGETTLALQLAASRVVLVSTPEPTALVDAYANLKVLWRADPAKPVDVVINDAEDDGAANQAYEQLSRAAEHFLGRTPGWLGLVYSDPRVAEAVRRQRSLMELYPDSPAGRCYEQIALRLSLGNETREPAVDYWKRLMPTAEEELAH